MKRKPYYILFFFLSLLYASRSIAQLAGISVDKNTIQIGEQVKLSLYADETGSNSSSLSGWFHFPDTINHFEVINRGKIDTVITNGQSHYTQNVIITSFDSGSWEIPPLKILFKDDQTHAVKAKQTLSIKIDVLPADISMLHDYHDTKEIIRTQVHTGGSNYKIIISMVLFIMLLLLTWYILKQRKKNEPLINKSIHDPHAWAIKQLASSEKLLAANKVSLKEFYDQLYHTCRQYFFLEFSEPVLYHTTSEWVKLLQTFPVEQNLKNEFNDLLNKIDTIRFSEGGSAGKQDTKKVIALVRSMINRLGKMKHDRSKKQIVS